MVSGITQKSCGALFPLWPLQKNINGFPDFLKNVCFEKIVKVVIMIIIKTAMIKTIMIMITAIIIMIIVVVMTNS